MESVNIKDIAKRAGVSTSMVSRVINGKSYVNPEKRAHIRDLIEETGYVPNNAARNMVMQQSFSVGILLPNTYNMFQRQLLSVIERQLASFGYQSLFFFVPQDERSEEETLVRLKSHRLDGIILLQEVKNKHFYDYFGKKNLPTVAVTFEYEGCPSVFVNDENAAFEAVNHLITIGHKKIGMINGAGYSFGRKRQDGFYRALENAGLDKSDSAVVTVREFTAEYGFYGMRELLLQMPDVTGVFAANDELAIGAIRVLLDHGKHTPSDVSIIGFDDIEIANYMMPRLTTIRQPIHDLGEKTASLLHRLISGLLTNECNYEMPYQLLVRESTAHV